VARHGSSDDEGAVLALAEVEANSTGAVEGTVQVGLNNLVPLLDGSVEDTVVGGLASVGNEDIDLAEVLDDVRNELLALLICALVMFHVYR
jgi:hypothetical protein